jgi:hypothetical protein
MFTRHIRTVLTEYRDRSEAAETLPGDAGWILNPVFVRFGVTAVRAFFFQNIELGAIQLCAHGFQFRLVVELKTQMIDADRAAAIGNREIEAWFFQHPLRVIAFENAGFSAEERGVKADTFFEIVDAYMYVEAFHAVLLLLLAGILPGAQAISQALPRQQF